ncbi:MAG: UDP-glucose 4-epimerase GalE [Paracoccaceae bacterium]|jgi:UDP-glucose 4-epimerase|nr:UDP-glucose 4-epimerase GalE [Paracoccaceae bacterium]
MTKRILLAGGAGYIGSHTYVALIEAGYDVVILDNFANASRRVPGALEQVTGLPVTLVEGDVLDRNMLDRLFAEHAFDAVIHFAALKAVGESVEKPLDYFHCNIGGLVTLMQAMAAAGVFTLVFSSSAAVYGVPEVLPIPETAPRSHANPYGYTKLVGEEVIEQATASDARWSVGVLRYFNPVGAHPSGLIGEDPTDRPNNLMPYVAKVAAGELPEIAVFGDDYPTPDGSGVRDFIHVCDLAQGHVLSLEALFRDGTGHVVNLGTGRGYSVLELITAYSTVCGRALPFRIAPRRPGDPAASYADPSKARALLGFEATRDLEDMCASSWNWIRNGAR